MAPTRWGHSPATMTQRFLVLVFLALWLAAPAHVSAVVFSSFEDLPLPKESAVPKPLAEAIALLRAGKTAEAREKAGSFVKGHPASAPGYEVLGAAALMEGDLDQAHQALTKALELEPKRLASILLLGRIELEQEHPVSAEKRFSEVLAFDPRHSGAYLGRAVALLRMNRLKEAASAAERGVALSRGEDPGAKQVLAGIYHELERHAEAEELLNDVLLAMPDSHEALLLQGLVKVDLRKLDEAAILLRLVLESNPASRWARLGLGVIARMSGQIDEGRAMLEALTKEAPGWALAHFRLGEVLLVLGELDPAVAEFHAAAATSNDPAFVHVRSGTALLTYGAIDLAIAEAKEAVAGGAQATVPARTLLIEAYLAKRRPDLAEQELLKAIREQPEEPTWPERLGRLYLANAHADRALAQFARWAELAPGSSEPVNAMVEALVALGRSDQALALAKKIASTQPDAPKSTLFLGSVHEMLGQWEEAELVYRRVLERHPSHLDTTLVLASLYRRTKRADQARAEIEDALKTHPGAGALHTDLGLIHQEAGRSAEAIAAYRHAIQHSRDNVLALNNLAFLLSQQPGHLDEAVELAGRAYAAAPGSPQIADTLGWLTFLRGDVERAVRLLTFAGAALPADPQIQAHLQAAQEARKAGQPHASTSL